jgi:uncharacterized protein (DUF697 family)
MPSNGEIKKRVNSMKERLKQEFFEIEKRSDLTREAKVGRIRHATCAACAGLAVQPIPFADIFVLTPLQGLMGYKIAQIYSIQIREQEIGEILKEILGLVGLSLAAQQLAIGAYKLAIPFLGALTTIPLVYSLTYAIGGAMDYYFRQKKNNKPVDPSVIKNIWKVGKKEGEAMGKERQEEIKDAWGRKP